MKKMTGTAIPLSALKTKNSIGCGEYPDLANFADFCKQSNLKIIQLLPLNDTGTSSSPYNALSAFALHPIYISIKDLPEIRQNAFALNAIQKLTNKHSNNKRFNYSELRTDKLSLLHEIYSQNIEKIKKDNKLALFIEENLNWLPAYCVYMVLKEKNKEASWKEWESHKIVKNTTIKNRWGNTKLLEKHLFFAWTQFRAQEQLLKATQYVKKLEILLKGDIPILMNEDSVDAWAFPQYFNTKLRAGAPADGMNPEGQCWGFPTYNWKRLSDDNFIWWKDRLKQASKFYEIYRIDHVLGFFRIWSIPEGEYTALNGWPQPFNGITQEELYKMGYTDENIRWFSKPHVPTNAIEPVNNNDYLATHGQLQKIMDRIGNEELWIFKNSIRCDQDIWDREDIPLPIRQKLVEFWKNRMFVEPEKNIFCFQWTYKNSTAWQSLNEEQKMAFEAFRNEKNSVQEKMWTSQAMKILGTLKNSTKMIACAEDLGAMPDCVPKVLEELGILGLRVIRWNRKWDQPNQPYYDFSEYPELSVATTSVHDSSTLRLWWLNEEGAKDFYKQFPPSSIIDFKYNEAQINFDSYNSETARYILTAIDQTSSLLCIHPIQDFLALIDSYSDTDANSECINIPGSVTDFNWTYRLPKNIDDLTKDKKLCTAISNIAIHH